MPSFTRQRSNSPEVQALSGSPPTKTVGFPSSPVTSVSRPLTNTELWTLYHFEAHARLCAACRNPYAVHKAGGRLCHVGHGLAQGVATVVYSQADGKETFDAASAFSAGADQVVRVEMPFDYDETRSLLRAMERSLRHRRRQRPIVSFDKTYVVAPRNPIAAAATVQRAPAPERRRSTKQSSSSSSARSEKQEHRSSSPPAAKYERRKPEIVDWPADEPQYEIREPPSSTSRALQRSASQRQPPTTRADESAAALTVRQSETPGEAYAVQDAQRQAPVSARLQPVHAAASEMLRRVTANPAPAPAPAEAAPTATRQRSSTLSSRERQDRRRSMYAEPTAAAYNTEVREPRRRANTSSSSARRHSALYF